MPTVVVPFRGETAKQRLAPAPDDVRAGPRAGDARRRARGRASRSATVVVADEPGGQGPAVEGALRRVERGPVLVVNADLPCARPRDLLTLLGALPEGGLALVAAADGTTNALALAAPHLFAPLYGPGSAERFLARAERLGVARGDRGDPNLADDVDTLADLERLEGRARRPHARGARRAARRLAAVKVVVLAGGLGGSRLARALAEAIDPAELTIVGNVGDDVEVLGLHVSPDLDTILYTLTGRLDESEGWGRAGETWNALETAAELGGETWFRLGDRDLGAPSRPHPGAAPRRAALGRDGAARARLRARAGAAAGDGRAAAHLARDARRRAPVPGVVRRARPPRRGRRRPLRGRRGRAAGARGARGARGGRPDRDRAEQPVRQHRPDPRRGRDPRGARAAHACRRRGQPADRRPAVRGPADRMLRAPRAAEPARSK